MRLKEAMEIAATCCDFCTGFDGPEPITVNQADEAAAVLRRAIPFVEETLEWMQHCLPDGPKYVEGCATCDAFMVAYRAFKEGK